MAEGEVLPPSNRKSYAKTVGFKRNSIKSHEFFFQEIAIELKSEVVKVREVAIYKNEPFIQVTKEEIQKLSAWFKYGLVGKFSYSKPSIIVIQQALNTFEFTGEVTLGKLDAKHVILNFSHEEDYYPIFSKSVWYIQGVPMRILKYTYDFDPQKESPIIPVWIALPKLPLVFYDKAILYSIASVIGKPLKLDEQTAKKSRTNLDRICVELDINAPRLERIRIGNEDFSMWQNLYYEEIPHYCSFCKHIGHNEDLNQVPLRE